MLIATEKTTISTKIRNDFTKNFVVESGMKMFYPMHSQEGEILERYVALKRV